MNDSTDDHAVEQHGHQRGKPEFIAQLIGADGGKQRRQRAEHDVKNRAAADDVGKQASDQRAGTASGISIGRRVNASEKRI